MGPRMELIRRRTLLSMSRLDLNMYRRSIALSNALGTDTAIQQQARGQPHHPNAVTLLHQTVLETRIGRVD